MDNIIRLLRRGCDPFIRDSKGRTALDISIINHTGSRNVEILRDYMQALSQGVPSDDVNNH